MQPRFAKAGFKLKVEGEAAKVDRNGTRSWSRSYFVSLLEDWEPALRKPRIGG